MNSPSQEHREHGPPRTSGRRTASFGLAVLAGLALTILLSLCIVAAILPALGVVAGSLTSNSPIGGNGTSIASSSPRATMVAPTTTSAPPSDWFTLISGGFTIEIPRVLGASHGYFIDDFTGTGVDLTYNGAPATTPLQQLAMEVTVLYASKITDRNICPQGGTPVRVGGGDITFAAWEQDSLSPATAVPSVQVNLVLNGVAIEIDLLGQGPSTTFLARYGSIWRHILTSFAPTRGASQPTSNPCS